MTTYYKTMEDRLKSIRWALTEALTVRPFDKYYIDMCRAAETKLEKELETMSRHPSGTLTLQGLEVELTDSLGVARARVRTATEEVEKYEEELFELRSLKDQLNKLSAANLFHTPYVPQR